MINQLYNVIINSVYFGPVIFWIALSIVLFLVYKMYISNKKAIISSIVIGFIFSFLTYPLNLILLAVFNILYPVHGYDPSYIFIYFSFFSFIFALPFSLIINYVYNSKIAIKMGILTFAILYFAAIIIVAFP